jgi:hypothetical protein
MGELQRRDHLRIGRRKGSLDLIGTDSKTCCAGVEPVKAQAELVQCRVTAGSDLLDDGAHIGLDILGNLALGGQERGKTGLEIRLPVIQPQYHCPAPSIPVLMVSAADRMARPELGFPPAADIGELHFDTINLELDRRPAGQAPVRWRPPALPYPGQSAQRAANAPCRCP